MRAAAIVLTLLATPTLAASTATNYRLDPVNSDVTAKVAFFGLASKTARFPGMSGSVRLDPDSRTVSKIDVVIDANRLEAPDEVTLQRLRGEKFFWVERYPQVRFSGNRITMRDELSGTVAGNLTARGVTNPAVLDVTFSIPPTTAKPDQPIRITGETIIDRRDYGMKSYRLIVGTKVNIRIKATMRPN